MYLHLGQTVAPAVAQSLTRVRDTKLAPFRGICRLVIGSYANKTEVVGTGILISRFHVLTCAHNIYPPKSPKTGRITVFPGQNGPDEYVPSIKANGWAISPGWRANDCHTFGEDVGIVRLGHPVETGFLALRPFDPATLVGATAHMAGYPGDRRPGARFMFQSQGPIEGAIQVRSCTLDTTDGVILPNIQEMTSLIAHRLDTAPAQSGSPMWIVHEGRLVLVAIHTGANAGGHKQAVLLNEGVRRRVDAWMTRTLPALQR